MSSVVTSQAEMREMFAASLFIDITDKDGSHSSMNQVIDEFVENVFKQVLVATVRSPPCPCLTMIAL